MGNGSFDPSDNTTRTTMKKPTLFNFQAADVSALMMLFGFALAAPAAFAADEVRISGRLSADELAMTDAVLVVELNEDLCIESTLQPNGKFEFKLPVGSKARLVFEKPGYKTKEVLVDTKNALNTPQARKANKNVEFAVVLESVEERKFEAYIGPVGYIQFVNGTGIMRIRHDERTVEVIGEPIMIRKEE